MSEDTRPEDFLLYQSARARMDAGSFEEAAELLRRSAAIRPHHKTLELLGQCYSALGRDREAVVPLAAATALNRQSRAPALLAEALERLGAGRDARAMAETALERDPSNRTAREVLERLSAGEDGQAGGAA